MQCIKGDVKLLRHTCTTYQRKVNDFNMTYTQHEYIHRENVKLPLHISNNIKTIPIYDEGIYQNIMIPIYDTN